MEMPVVLQWASLGHNLAHPQPFSLRYWVTQTLLDHQGFTIIKGSTSTLVGKIKEHRQKRTFWRDIERAF
jgi:hypothetical protein